MTIRGVADRAGVSTMTVSNVVNNTGKVAEETRQLVLAAIRDLGYVPNSAARALASAGSARIGIIYLNPQNAFLSAMLVGALHSAGGRGAQVIIRDCPDVRFDSVAASLRALVASGANGLLLAPPFAELVSGTGLIPELGVPAAAVATGRFLPDVSTIRIDDLAAARTMTELLIRQGHRRIGFIEGSAAFALSRTRRIGYEAALAAYGLEASAELIEGGDFTYEGGLAAAERLIDLSDRPTAIFCSNDDMAAAAVSLAHRRGLNVPEDIAIVGFDDTPIAVKIWPALTTVRQPIAAMAERAAEHVINTIQQGPAGDGVIDEIMSVEIIQRESTNLRRTTSL